jgi:aspartate carbamoyltransferase catalytic subunit
MKLNRKDILGIQELSVDEINLILETADSFIEISTREIKKVPTLRGKTIINLFYEASTRTRTSFEIAAKRLSADTINISASTSGVVKETCRRRLEAMNPDIIVIRTGAHMLAGISDSRLSTPAMGRMSTRPGALGHDDDPGERIAGLVAIVGDIATRVARQHPGLTKMGPGSACRSGDIPAASRRWGSLFICASRRRFGMRTSS